MNPSAYVFNRKRIQTLSASYILPILVYSKRLGGGGGVMHPREEAEGQRLKNPFDTITEALGINRLTQNFMMS